MYTTNASLVLFVCRRSDCALEQLSKAAAAGEPVDEVSVTLLLHALARDGETRCNIYI